MQLIFNVELLKPEEIPAQAQQKGHKSGAG
jgi:hypothetical protein